MATLNQIATGTLRLAKDCPSPQPVSVSVLTEAALRIHQRAIDAKRARLVKDDTRGDYRRSVHPRNSAGSLQSDCQCARCHTGRRYRASPCEEERRQGAHRGRRQWPWHIKRECRAALSAVFHHEGRARHGARPLRLQKNHRSPQWDDSRPQQRPSGKKRNYFSDKPGGPTQQPQSITYGIALFRVRSLPYFPSIRHQIFDRKRLFKLTISTTLRAVPPGKATRFFATPQSRPARERILTGALPIRTWPAPCLHSSQPQTDG